MHDIWQILTVFLGGVCTLAIFSFLIKENSVYRFFEHLFIGIASGFGIVFTVKNLIWPKLLVPAFGLDILVFPDGTQSTVYNPLELLVLIPMAFGLLYYFIYSKKYSWLAKLVIGFSLGTSGGLAFKGFFNKMLPQLSNSLKPLLVYSADSIDLYQSFSNTVFVFTLLSVMYYFFFSFKIQTKLGHSVATSGRWLMMVCFGAFFGSTVMARMALLVERLQFLLDDWFGLFFRFFS
ncbi:MAG: hypothetical protein KDD56_04270 [Bdellovibrionales bacterium]|nr:hypothetical protein [Bdellovibrionales bacterium]